VIRLELPLPPTSNNLFINGRKGKGRFTNPIYAKWQWEAAAALQKQKPAEGIKGPYRFWMTVPMDMRGDIDNRIKPALDFCVVHAITSDDRHCHSAKIERGAAKPGFCIIEIESASGVKDVA
jgi:Holliday junction resolvase RusA-like endonuclease